jgi:hypothetical protein
MSRHYSYEINDFTQALKNCELALRGETDERARWFASRLRDLLSVAGEIYHSNPSADTWVAIREFQLQEIHLAKKQAQEKIAKLEAEESALMPKLESALNDLLEARAEKAMQV